MTPISAVIITFNEADNIARCLDALRDVADEIIVVDSYSTDRTPDICQQYDGVVFLQRKWQGYAATKNWANAQAKHPYILSIDADEVVDDPLKKSILQARTKGLSGAYSVNRKTNYCGHWVKHGGWYPDRKVRLFHRDKARWEGDFVHETLQLDEGVELQSLQGHLLHFSYHRLEDHRQRARKYAGLHAQKMFTSGRHTTFVSALLSAGWKFIAVYFFKLGLLDGWAGWHIARFSAWAVFLKHQELLQLYAKQRNENHR